MFAIFLAVVRSLTIEAPRAFQKTKEAWRDAFQHARESAVDARYKLAFEAELLRAVEEHPELDESRQRAAAALRVPAEFRPQRRINFDRHCHVNADEFQSAEVSEEESRKKFTALVEKYRGGSERSSFTPARSASFTVASQLADEKVSRGRIVR